MANRKFKIFLIKPSHYDNDGYVIQWMRSSIPSNSLASVYALLAECADNKVLGPDVEIAIDAFDECNTVINVKRIIREIRRGRRRLHRPGRRAVEPVPARGRHRRANSAPQTFRWSSAASTPAAASRCCPSCRPT